MVIVNLLLATLCFGGQCYPALVGPTTPRGQFPLVQRQVISPGYGGDVMVFKEDDKNWWAVHRVWLLNPAQHRLERLRSTDPRGRQSITNGCINIEPDVYERLVQSGESQITVE